ncbi:MAG: hypothetical protein AAF654_07010 [Myxococcota bacterium]
MTLLALVLLAAEPPFDVEGELVFNRYVYASVGELSSEPVVTVAMADRVEGRIRRFLRRSGYSLATVETEIQPNGRLLVRVDEGRLRRIRILGRGAFQTLNVRFKLDLPFDVFNRLALESSLASLSKDPITYRVVPVDKPVETGIDLSALESVDFGTFGLNVKNDGRYELIIELPPKLVVSGWDVALSLDSFGLGVNGKYQGARLASDSDRWTAEAGAAMNFFEVPGGSSGRVLEPSRIYGEARYVFPAMLAVRPILRTSADFVLRQRFDLGIADYSLTQFGTGLGLNYDLTASAEMTLSGSLVRREARIEEFIDGFPVPGEVAELRDRRATLSLEWDAYLGVLEERPDRAQRLRGEVTYFFPGETEKFVRGEFRYRKVFEFGWHDLWVNSAGGIALGDFTLYDEIPVGNRYLRGVFGQQRFVQSIASLGLGYRWALNRDVIKVGPYHDFAVFYESDFGPGSPEVRYANSIGLGIHLLLLDLFQFDLYTGGGFLSDGSVDFGTSLRIRNAF